MAASCESYDKGNEWEGPRLATAVYTLVHDGSRAVTSLLTRLGLRASLRFVCTGRDKTFPEMNLLTPPLIGFVGTPTGMRFVPQCTLGLPAPPPTEAQFETWWTKEGVYRPRMAPGATDLTRKRLVFALRHQDGSGHVGELTDDSYVRLKAGAGVSTRVGRGPSRPMIEAANATMRQVAWEITETLTQLGEKVD